MEYLKLPDDMKGLFLMEVFLVHRGLKVSIN